MQSLSKMVVKDKFILVQKKNLEIHACVVLSKNHGKMYISENF